MLIKRFKKSLLTLILASSMFLSVTGVVRAENNTYYKESDKVLALDSGHNIFETYKCDYNGKLEAYYNYEITQRVIKNIKQQRQDIKIYETNPNNTNIGRSKRADECRKNNVDFILSIHQDAISHNEQNNVIGTHMIVDKDSKENVTTYIAKQMIKNYSSKTGIPIRGGGVDNIRDDVGILNRATELGIPSILLECNFYDNNTYNDLINTKEGLDNIANAISDSIILHIVTYLDKTHSSEVNPQNQYIKFRIN